MRKSTTPWGSHPGRQRVGASSGTECTASPLISNRLRSAFSDQDVSRLDQQFLNGSGVIIKQHFHTHHQRLCGHCVPKCFLERLLEPERWSGALACLRHSRPSLLFRPALHEIHFFCRLGLHNLDQKFGIAYGSVRAPISFAFLFNVLVKKL
mmetsp:Transcript_36917/g.88441  ORF Transcript_36917/g.88441 Transcript_36917/m.88441 type:complete len:152 (-) Transcript_36917:880-1335(-)